MLPATCGSLPRARTVKNREAELAWSWAHRLRGAPRARDVPLRAVGGRARRAHPRGRRWIIGVLVGGPGGVVFGRRRRRPGWELGRRDRRGRARRLGRGRWLPHGAA